MQLERWKFLVIVVGVVVGIAGIYLGYFIGYGEAVSPKLANVLDVREVDSYMKGQTKNLRGKVIKANEAKDNLYFTLQDVHNNTTIKGVLFAKTNSKNPSRKQIILNSRDNQTVIYVKGKIDVYNGELEIITWDVKDSEEKNVDFPKPGI